MSSEGIVLFALAAAAAIAPASPAATPSGAPSPVQQISYQAVLDERTGGYPGSGLVAVTIEDGKTTLRTAGTSGTKRPIDDRTIFEVGSVTKTFTATVLATMVLDGSVKLSDPVQEYLPPSVHVPTYQGKQITLLDLATQHSGLPRLPTNIDSGKTTQPYETYTVPMMYDFLSGYKLRRAPGGEFEYSNYAVALLGQALANRAGMSFEEVLRKRVLTPLGMNDTFLVMSGGLGGLSPEQRARFAAGTTIDGEPMQPWAFDSIAPAGALASSAADMEKYLRCNMGDGPLARACLFAQTPRASMPGGKIGLIWWTSDTTHIIHHGGDTYSYHAAVAVSADRKSGVVVLADGGANVEDVAFRALDPTQPVAVVQPVAAMDRMMLSDYAGTYESKREGAKYVVEVRGDRLMAKLDDQEYAGIYPTAKDMFKYRVVDAKVAFTRTPEGVVNAAVLFQNGGQIVFVKPGMQMPSAIPNPFPAIIAVSQEQLEQYTGHYASVAGMFYVTREVDKLYVRLQGQSAFEVFPSAKDEFFYKVVDAQISFVRDASGKVTGLTLHQGGSTVQATRQ